MKMFSSENDARDPERRVIDAVETLHITSLQHSWFTIKVSRFHISGVEGNEGAICEGWLSEAEVTLGQPKNRVPAL